jgi:hypothetical protein
MFVCQVPGSTTARPAMHPVQINSTRTTSGKELVAAPKVKGEGRAGSLARIYSGRLSWLAGHVHVPAVRMRCE